MKPYLSIVIPVYNERDNIADLAAEIAETAKVLARPVEAIWVDDGSIDGSFAEIKAACVRYGWMRGLRFGRNFGQTAALAAGITEATGEIIVLMDADGQNNPSDIPRMTAKLEEGFDLVSGWRKNRHDDFLTRRLPSMAANWIIAKVTGIHIHDYGCTLKAYRSQYLKAFRIYGEMHRFLPAFAGSLGAKIAELEVTHRPRLKGRSKYGLSRTLKVLLDLATVKFMGQYLAKPIYIFGGWGVLCTAASAVLAAVTLYNKFYHALCVKDQPLFIIAIFLGLIGVQMILLGLLSEVVSRVYYEINSRPPYFVRERTTDDPR